MSEHTATASQLIAASTEEVFDAWIDAKTMGTFLCPIPGGSARATSDGREGGAFTVEMIAPGGESIPHTGIYATVDRPRELAFSWNSPYTQDSVVRITFAPKDGKTEVVLVHTNLPDEEQARNHTGGWASILQRLEEVFR